MNIFRKLIPAPALFITLLLSLNLTAQTLPPAQPDPPKNWHTMDLKADGFYGISLVPAYQFVQGKKSKTVLVATIDSGIDTAQKDLQGILWLIQRRSRAMVLTMTIMALLMMYMAGIF